MRRMYVYVCGGRRMMPAGECIILVFGSSGHRVSAVFIVSISFQMKGVCRAPPTLAVSVRASRTPIDR